PRFVPPGHVRKLGFKGKDLYNGSGAWMTYEEAKAWVDTNLAAINAARGGARPAKLASKAGDTVADLLNDWLNSDRVRTLAAKTQLNYKNAVDAMMFKPRKFAPGRRPRRGDSEFERETFSLMPVAGVRPPELTKFVEYVIRARGLGTGQGVAGAYSAAYMWGATSTKWRLPAHLNPRPHCRFPDKKGRVSVWSPQEFKAMIEAADRIGRPSIGDAIYLGIYTGQRQSDRLAFVEDGYEDGRRKLRQGKTGVVVRLEETADLKARLQNAHKRRRELQLRFGNRNPEIVLNEETGEPWADSTYRKVFRWVRDEAAKTVPSVVNRTDQDLRDTCVTWLYRAGVDPIAICDVTGHSYDSISLIIKHYLGRDPKRADAGLKKMEAFLANELA